LNQKSLIIFTIKIDYFLHLNIQIIFDTVDWKMINILQENARLPYAEKKIFLSPSSVRVYKKAGGNWGYKSLHS
jgi:hypothetical protein